MRHHLFITQEPLVPTAPVFSTGSGAWAEFYGVVRGQEGDQPIAGLDYECYEAMARRELERIILALGSKHAVQEIWLTHRIGRVLAGEPSLHIRVRSAHRAAALALIGELIDEMKRSVPIWKRPFPSDASLGSGCERIRLGEDGETETLEDR